MRKSFAFIITLLAVFLLPVLASAQQEDMRQMHIQAREKRQALLEQARREKQAALREARLAREKILSDRQALKGAIAGLEDENQEYEENIENLQKNIESLGKKEQKLDTDLSELKATVNELSGAIKANAKDVAGLVHESLGSASYSRDVTVLEEIAEEDRFPGMEDIRMISEILEDEIRLSGNVRLIEDMIVDRSGRQTKAEILLIGNFTAAYRTDDETGFLNPSFSAGPAFALSSLPPRRIQGKINAYMDGKSMEVPMDVSRGGALRQLVHELSLWEQISEGGPIVWPILFLLGLGIIIVAERTVFLARKRFDSKGFMRCVEELLEENRFEECRKACEKSSKKPLPRVINAGLACCHMPREEMENALQEAILREIPPMERFLSTLGMLAAIAPLLGLLGTVTGMINTFHVITSHGTGDPRIMSGGISEALVTTMLGLAVAIPMLMAHTWLGRAVDKTIGEMEEKAVALVNMVHKTRHSHTGAGS